MKELNLKHFNKKDLYEWEEIVDIIEEMENEIETLNEKINEIENDIESNYKRIPMSDYTGDSYDDRF